MIHRIAWKALPALLVSLLAVLSAARAADLPILNGDFETPHQSGTPTGWAMWGADRDKVPANYARDTDIRRTGTASLRLKHPANTRGYLVTDPAHAIQPKRDRRYTIRFWARADTPGTSLFGLTAYERVQPFVDAPSPGFITFTAGPEWREYTYTVDEGYDFFADRSRYLLLSFHATPESTVERTVWIDDITVDESPSPRQGRLEDPKSVPYVPVDHRFKPGERFDITIDASRRLYPAPRRTGGVSFHRLVGWTGQPYNKAGDFTLVPELEKAMKEMRLPMTRFYGVGDEPFGIEGSIDRAAEIAERIGVPTADMVLELETHSATTKIPPADWARAVRYSREKGYGFRYWEVANEPYLSRETAFPTPESYIEHFNGVSAAIRAADPKAKVGVAIDPNSLKWGNQVLKSTVGGYDFVVGHHYSSFKAYGRDYESVVLGDNQRMLERVARLNGLIRAYNPGRDVYQLDTEWGMHSSGINGERADYVDRNANVMGTLHRAVRLIYYTRENMVQGASSWQMFSRLSGQGFGILSPDSPEKRLSLYWLYYHFNRHVGENVVAVSGTAPYVSLRAEDFPWEDTAKLASPLTPALATTSADGKYLYLVVANGSWDKSIPMQASLKGFAAGSAGGVILSPPGGLDGKPLLERAEDAVTPVAVAVKGGVLDYSLPPHSVLFLTLERGK